MRTGSNRSVTFVIYGEPASKANSRKVVRFGQRLAIIKSKKALSYVKHAAMQVRQVAPLLEGRLCAHITIYYASERPDLDASVIFDCLQGRVYANDRQVREMHLFQKIDKRNPRAEITISEV